MNEQEIREAVKGIKEHYGIDEKTQVNDWLQTLVDLGEDYLSVKGLPEEKEEIFPEDFKCGGCGNCEACLHYSQYGDYEKNISNSGFNQALHLCKLSLIKSVPSEELIRAELCMAFGQANEQGIIVDANFDYKSLAASLHKLYLERLGVKEGK